MATVTIQRYVDRIPVAAKSGETERQMIDRMIAIHGGDKVYVDGVAQIQSFPDFAPGVTVVSETRPWTLIPIGDSFVLNGFADSTPN